MDLIEWVEVRNKGKILSGVMPVKSINSEYGEYEGMNIYAFKYSIPNTSYGSIRNDVNICIIFLDEPYIEAVCKTFTTYPVFSAEEKFKEDITRKFLKFNDIELMKWISAYVQKYGHPIV